MNYVFIIIIALITALACAIILTPLAGRNKRMEFALCLILFSLGGFSFYLAIGDPDKAGAYAAFAESGNERAHKRKQLARLRTLERTVNAAEKPDIDKLIALGTLRQRLSRHRQAITAFKRAKAISENYATLARKLGKAYFRAGIAAMRDGRRQEAARYWQKALELAPRDAPYLPVIEKGVQQLKGNNQAN